MSLLNVPYFGKKAGKSFLHTVSIKRTVAKKFKITLLKVLYIVIKGDLRYKIKYILHHNSLGGYFMESEKMFFCREPLHYSLFKIQILD